MYASISKIFFMLHLLPHKFVLLFLCQIVSALTFLFYNIFYLLTGHICQLLCKPKILLVH